ARHFESAKPTVYDWCDYFAFVKRDASIDDSTANSRLPHLLIHFRIDTPDLPMRFQIDRVDNAPRRDSVENSVEHQWRVFLMRLRITGRERKRYRPRQPQPVHVRCVDLF